MSSLESTQSTITGLETLRDSLIAYLQAEIANPKPNYSIKGTSISWDEHRRQLFDEIGQITDQIKELISLKNILDPYQEALRHSL